MDEQTLRQTILTAFEYAYMHEDWVNPLDDALVGVTAEQAAWRPPGSEDMGIWDIVLHVAVWNENIVERIETGQNTHPTEGAWPARAAVLDDAAWEAAKQRLRDSLDSVHRLIETVPFEKIDQSPYGLPDLMCRFNHVAYHLGQITKIRECRGF